MRLFRCPGGLAVLMFLVVASVVAISCRKEKSEIEGVTGVAWRVSMLQETNDYYINPLPTGWQFDLRADKSFVFRLNGAVGRGTYSWTTVDTTSIYHTKAQVRFSILQWASPAEGPGLMDKMKRVLQGVHTCYVDKHPSGAMKLQFEGSTGYFQVSRQ